MSFRLKCMALATRLGFKSVLAKSHDVDFIRTYWNNIAKRTFKQPAGIISEPMVLSALERNVSGLYVHAGHRVGDAVLLYIHGGGFIFGDAKSYRHMVGDLSKRTGFPAYIPNYGLAPENPFPDGLNDVKTCYQALRDKGYNANQIVLGGDSAGGNLVLSLLAYLISKHEPLPACTFTISAVVDLTYSSQSIQTNAKSDACLAANQCDFVRAQYLGDHDPKDPAVSPLYANFKGATPVLMHASSKEILRDDTLRMTENLAGARVKVQTRFWRNNYHVFHLLRGKVREADEALGEIAQFILKHVPPKSNDS